MVSESLETAGDRLYKGRDRFLFLNKRECVFMVKEHVNISELSFSGEKINKQNINAVLPKSELEVNRYNELILKLKSTCFNNKK